MQPKPYKKRPEIVFFWWLQWLLMSTVPIWRRGRRRGINFIPLLWLIQIYQILRGLIRGNNDLHGLTVFFARHKPDSSCPCWSVVSKTHSFAVHVVKKRPAARSMQILPDISHFPTFRLSGLSELSDVPLCLHHLFFLFMLHPLGQKLQYLVFQRLYHPAL